MSFSFIILLLTGLSGVLWVAVALGLRVGLGWVCSRERDGETPAASGGDESGLPRVSVLVAARNEEQVIGRCLEALAGQDYPAGRWEVLLIDDTSTDGTREIAGKFTGRVPGLRILEAGERPAGVAPKKHALTVGIDAATGDVILTTDADCGPPSGWVRQMAIYFGKGADAVVGFSPLRGSALVRFDGFVNAVVSAGSIGMGQPSTAVGRNFGYRKATWEAVGGFGSNASGASGDDDLLLQRIATLGGKVAFATDASTHIPADGAKSLKAWLRMKRRHISAGKRYKPAMIVVATGLYCYNLGLLLTGVLAILGDIPWQLPLLAWAAKALVDAAALARGAKLLNIRDWVATFMLVEAASPLIVTLLTPAALVGKVTWKGRLLEG